MKSQNGCALSARRILQCVSVIPLGDRNKNRAIIRLPFNPA